MYDNDLAALEIPAEVKQFMEDHQSWLEFILRTGRKSGELNFNETPACLSRMLK